MADGAGETPAKATSPALCLRFLVAPAVEILLPFRLYLPFGHFE